MLSDGVTDNFNVDIAEWAFVAKTSLEVRANDARAVFGVIILAKNHATVVQHAGSVG